MTRRQGPEDHSSGHTEESEVGLHTQTLPTSAAEVSTTGRRLTEVGSHTHRRIFLMKGLAAGSLLCSCFLPMELWVCTSFLCGS